MAVIKQSYPKYSAKSLFRLNLVKQVIFCGSVYLPPFYSSLQKFLYFSSMNITAVLPICHFLNLLIYHSHRYQSNHLHPATKQCFSLFVFLLKNLCNIGCINKPMASVDLERRYEEYVNLSGDRESRLQQMGYATTGQLPDVEVDSIEAFKSLIMHLEFSKRCSDKMSIEEMTVALKLFYKTYMKKKDILHLLKIGDSPFTEEELHDAMRIMPIDVDGGILIDDLTDFMYK